MDLDYIRLLRALAFVVYERLCKDDWIEDCEDIEEFLGD